MPRLFAGSRLRQARKAAGKSDAQMAIVINKSVALIHLVEAGHKIPSVRVLDDWCQELGVPIDFCFVDVDDEQVAAK
jgi:transcriptional regulator with XRE-family HTH domain